MSSSPQRRVVHLADAIVAGQGDGPLSPQPLPLGLLFAANNAAVMDWFGAQLLGYDPERLPIVREAFGNFRWPIATSRPSEKLKPQTITARDLSCRLAQRGGKNTSGLVKDTLSKLELQRITTDRQFSSGRL